MTAKTSVRDFTPPCVWRFLARLRPQPPGPPEEPRIAFRGSYASWEEATRASEGYSAPEILARTRAAMLKVRNGECAFERDSVAFPTMEHQFPLLTGLLYAAARDGRLNVLDFGGALGSTYYQCRTFLRTVRELRWSVVEQPLHVACGNAEFADGHLRFFDSIDGAMTAPPPNVLLLSGVVQCLPAPYEFLTEVLARSFPYVVVDRTAFMRDGSTRLTVEHVPATIYSASYPSWFLSEPRFLSHFTENHRLLASFPALDRAHPEGGLADYKGFIFERTTGQPASAARSSN